MQFHILSFEGPDPYARAGGIASRVDGMVQALVAAGHPTHLWFVGDPTSPGHERRGNLHLHRWCQWISRYHPTGVYDGEEGKERDFAASLPPFLIEHHLAPALAAGQRAVVLAEEWHTAHAVLHLQWLLRQRGMDDRVSVFWNANNVFGFERIDWASMARAATLTTVSRYMRQRMWSCGIDPLVIPNGLGADAYTPAPSRHVRELERLVSGRSVLAKVARWDPDKRWLNAIDIVAELRRIGWRPLLIARGGSEAHGWEVLSRARALGLRVGERTPPKPGGPGLLSALSDADDIDVMVLQSHLDPGARRLLFRGAHAVLANSAHEPFGLVGLEAMAAGGIACTGGTGEDYVVPGRNALVLQTDDPREFVSQFAHLRNDDQAISDLRRAARRTSRDFAWSQIVGRNLLPRVQVDDASRCAPIAREGVVVPFTPDATRLAARMRTPRLAPAPAFAAAPSGGHAVS
jgi:glycosyltransferase involved in cell wall biosynthesis